MRAVDPSEVACRAAFDRAEVGGGAGRLVPRIFADGLAVLDDSYNANPASMRASIAAAAEIARATGRRLVLVLGEMRELGAGERAGHDEVGRAAAESGAALVIAVARRGARASPTRARAGGVDADLRRATSRDAPPRSREPRSRAGDFVLVKASRGVATERVVAALVRRCTAASARTTRGERAS